MSTLKMSAPLFGEFDPREIDFPTFATEARAPNVITADMNAEEIAEITSEEAMSLIRAQFAAILAKMQAETNNLGIVAKGL